MPKSQLIPSFNCFYGHDSKLYIKTLKRFLKFSNKVKIPLKHLESKCDENIT